MNINNKRWASFEEMYDDLKETPDFKKQLQNERERYLPNLIKSIEQAKTAKDFFDCTCKLSSQFESLEQSVIRELYSKTNIYVLVLNAVLRNHNFIATLSELFDKKETISILQNDPDAYKKLIFLNSGLSLAFLGISFNHELINDYSIDFLRRNINDLLKSMINRNGTQRDFVTLCYFLEGIAWNNRFHFNVLGDSKFPIKLDDKFLFDNLKTSRAFAGIIFTSLTIRPSIENRFKKVISMFSDPKFNISYAINSIYESVNVLDEKINHYYRTSSKDVTSFFDVFIRNNERHLIFFIKNFCAGFHYQGKKMKFSDILLNKLLTISDSKEQFIKYGENNFSAFRGSGGGSEWTNKIFLICIKSSSALEQLKKAKDIEWAITVIVYELRHWILDIHSVLNKYYIEDDWDLIKDYLIQENESIEWKSSFYTSLNQEYIDEETDALAAKALLDNIVKVLLSFLNTNGGVLLVGVVENASHIKRKEIEEFLITKNGVTFFDVSQELRGHNMKLDSVRLQILEKLKQLTDISTDNFNGLISFEPVIIRGAEQVVSIIKITVKKSRKLFFTVKKDSINGKIWISLTRRGQGQSIDVDVRDYIHIINTEK